MAIAVSIVVIVVVVAYDKYGDGDGDDSGNGQCHLCCSYNWYYEAWWKILYYFLLLKVIIRLIWCYHYYYYFFNLYWTESEDPINIIQEFVSVTLLFYEDGFSTANAYLKYLSFLLAIFLFL